MVQGTGVSSRLLGRTRVPRLDGPPQMCWLQGLSQQSPRALPSTSLLAPRAKVPTEPQGLAAVCANFTESQDGWGSKGT